MTKHDIGSLTAKMAGVYAGLQALSYFSAFTATFLKKDGAQIAISLIVPSLCLALAGAALFFGSGRMSTILLPPSDQSPAPSSLRASDIQVVAFSVVGLAIAIFALPDVARFFIDSAWWTISLTLLV